MALIQSEVIDDIKHELGHPTIRVELDTSVWDVIFRKAFRWFKAKKGFIKTSTVPLVDGQYDYDWPTDAYSITDVILPRRTDISDILSLGFFDIVPAAFVATASAAPTMQSAGTMRFDLSAYVQLLQGLEMRRRVFSAEPDWIEDVPNRKITLTNRNPVGFSIQNNPLWMVVYYKSETMALGDFHGRDEELIYRYCLARAKLVLGTTRAKYGSYPAAGGPISTDGEALKQEAYADLAQLDIEIDDSQGNIGGILQG
jgi:hypothetical protein